MTKTALTLLTGLALATSAQAGEDYSSKAPAPAPMPAPCLWTWFAGGSVGYLADAQDAMYTLHVGSEYKCPGSDSSHAVFLEIGYATDNFSDTVEKDLYATKSSSRITGDWSMVPVTLNYKYESVLSGNLNWYVGAGAGVAFGDISIDSNVHNIGDEDERFFFGQIFGGLVYNFSETLEAFGGVRYIYLNDGSDWNAYGEDTMFDLGLRYNF